MQIKNKKKLIEYLNQAVKLKKEIVIDINQNKMSLEDFKNYQKSEFFKNEL